MRTFEQVIDHLRGAVENPDQILPAFRELYAFVVVEENEFDRLPSHVHDVLLDLVLDLDYFEPDPKARREDPSFYGPARATSEIRKALDQLSHQGAV